MAFKQERRHVVPTPRPADKRSTSVLDLLQFAKDSQQGGRTRGSSKSLSVKGPTHVRIAWFQHDQGMAWC